MSVLNTLGQTVLPQVFAALNTAGLVDTMTIYGETNTSDGAGSFRKTQTTYATGVPVSYKSAGAGSRTIQGERVISSADYILTFPTHSNAGSRYAVDPTVHRLVVAARGNEPAKTFRVISISDRGGVVFDAVCIKEN